MERTIAYLYIFDGLADWEIGYLGAELASGRYFKKDAFKREIRTFSIERRPIVTMGGLRVIPDMGIEEVNVEAAALLILPGGDSWLAGDGNSKAASLARRFLEAGVPAAAICGATVGLAREGLLDDRAHTSVDPRFLAEICPSYRGAELYRTEGAVADQNLITASGVAPLEFARETLRLLNVMSEKTLAAWYELNRTRSADAYYALISSMEAK